MEELSKMHDRLAVAKAGRGAEEQSGRKKQTQLESMVHCGVCSQHYTDPQILNCQHSFCKNCLKKLKVKYKQEVRCLVCEHVTSLNDVRPDINKSQLIDVYQQQEREAEEHFDENGGDFVVHTGGETHVSQVPRLNLAKLTGQVEKALKDQCACNITAVTSRRQSSLFPCFQSKVTSCDASCDICSQPIGWFCNQCRQYLCDDCQMRHSKVNSTKHHICETVDDIAKQQQPVRPNFNWSSREIDFECLQIIKKHLTTISDAIDRLQHLVKQIEGEVLVTKTSGSNAMKESQHLREDWFNKVQLHFDTMDIKISEFVNARLESLNRLRTRVEMA